MNNDQYKARVAELETDNATLTHQRDEAQAQVSQLTHQRDEAQAQVSQLTTELGERTPAGAPAAEADPHAELKDAMRRNGHKAAYVAADGGTFFDREVALQAVRGVAQDLTEVTV